MGGVQTCRGHANIWACPNIQGAYKHMGVSKHTGGIKHMEASKHMGVSKHMGASKHTGGIQTWGCPNIWGHPNIQGASKHTGATLQSRFCHQFYIKLINITGTIVLPSQAFGPHTFQSFNNFPIFSGTNTP